MCKDTGADRLTKFIVGRPPPPTLHRHPTTPILFLVLSFPKEEPDPEPTDDDDDDNVKSKAGGAQTPPEAAQRHG